MVVGQPIRCAEQEPRWTPGGLQCEQFVYQVSINPPNVTRLAQTLKVDLLVIERRRGEIENKGKIIPMSLETMSRRSSFLGRGSTVTTKGLFSAAGGTDEPPMGVSGVFSVIGLN
jgi:hypothetical protein